MTQVEINKKILMRLLNAIWKAWNRGQKVGEMGVYKIRLGSTSETTQDAVLFENACDNAILAVLPLVRIGHGPHPSIFKSFDWISDFPGSVADLPGTRVLVIRMSSLQLLKLENVRPINNLYTRLRRARG